MNLMKVSFVSSCRSQANLVHTNGHRTCPHRAIATSAASPSGAACTRFTVSLLKPLGIELQQAKEAGPIIVSDVREDSAAAREGVQRGDQLVATSGVVYTKELDYAGATVKGGQQIVRLLVLGETFKTVGAAIRSHPGHIPVTLEFQRGECPPDPPAS